MWPAIIGAGAAALGGFLGYKGGQETNAQSLKIAREQMNFQKAMSDTAYPRAVQGMKDAGLNPMLAYSQGGASTPVGSMPQVQNAAAQGVASAGAATNAVASMQSVLQSKALMEKTEAETRQIDLESASRAKLLSHDATLKEIEEWIRSGTKAYSAKDIMASADIKETEARAREQTFASDVAQRKAASRLTQMEIPSAESSSRFYEDIGKSAPWIRFLLELAKGVSSAGRLAR